MIFSRYELAKGTNMVDYTEQLFDQVKGMEGVTAPAQGMSLLIHNIPLEQPS